MSNIRKNMKEDEECMKIKSNQESWIDIFET